jgi:glucose/arabinose dehydrogenase
VKALRPSEKDRQPARRQASAGAATAIAMVFVLAACAPASSGTAASTPNKSGATATALATASASASSHPSQSAAPTLRSGPDHIGLKQFASGLDQPIGITSAGDGSGRLYVNEQGGIVRIVEQDGSLAQQPFVDLNDRLVAGGEQGLLGLAFHPDFPQDGRVFVDYTRAEDGATVISELRATAEAADMTTERVLLLISQPFVNHNGGQLSFGPDGYLYIGMGDGGSGGDPFGNGQNRDALLGKILRIDVDGPHADGKQYAIPRDNPFAPRGAHPGDGAPEVWVYGLRNPWRFSFDRASGDLYIGDVGQEAWEEIDRQPADSKGGENYGWNVMEGNHCYQGSCDASQSVAPIAEYGHDLGCSVTGGYVYRGSTQPALQGAYFFADYCSGIVFTLHLSGGSISARRILDSGKSITSFGQGDDGELYLTDASAGAIFHIVAG